MHGLTKFSCIVIYNDLFAAFFSAEDMHFVFFADQAFALYSQPIAANKSKWRSEIIAYLIEY